MTASEEIKEGLMDVAAKEGGRFHKEVRERVGKKATPILERRLRLFIYSMPGMISCAIGEWSLKKPEQAGKVGRILLDYIRNSNDYLPESKLGLFGYLDDSYLAACVYEKIAPDPASAERMRDYKNLARLVIPYETRKIDVLVEQISVK